MLCYIYGMKLTILRLGMFRYSINTNFYVCLDIQQIRTFIVLCDIYGKKLTI